MRRMRLSISRDGRAAVPMLVHIAVALVISIFVQLMSSQFLQDGSRIRTIRQTTEMTLA